MTQSNNNSPYAHRHVQKQRENTKNATENFDYTTITKRRSIGVTTETKLVLWNRFTGSQPSHNI